MGAVSRRVSCTADRDFTPCGINLLG